MTSAKLGTMNPAADLATLFADGTITDEAGSAAVSAVLHEGQALGAMVLGAGLGDADHAEVHLVVRAHDSKPSVPCSS